MNVLEPPEEETADEARESGLLLGALAAGFSQGFVRSPFSGLSVNLLQQLRGSSE